MRWPALARAAAILIAAAAAFDPALTLTRPAPVTLGLVSSRSAAPLAARLRSALDGEFTFVDGASTATQALLVAVAPGEPAPAVPAASRAFVITEPLRATRVRITGVETPSTAIAGRTVILTADLDAAGLSGPVVTSLFAGDRLAARDERSLDTGTGRARVRLSFVPDAAGLAALRIEAVSGRLTARARSALVVEDRRLRAHFEDARPSWASTFVRRAIEQDAAFQVTSVSSTSRGVSAESGAAAQDDARAGADVIVAGGLSAAPPAAIDKLARFVRTGGSLVVIGDDEGFAGIQRLTGLSGWTRRRFDTPVHASGAHGTLWLSDALVTPDRSLPSSSVAALPDGTQVVQELPLGLGRVIVSGALDAWRHRARDQRAFAAFWRGVIGDAAQRAVRPLEVRVTPPLAAPGEEVLIEAAVRDLQARSIEVRATLAGEGAPQPIRLWPSPAPGVFHGRVAAPSRGGAVRVDATSRVEDGSGSLHASAPFLVDRNGSGISVDAAQASLAALASTHGGTFIAGGSLDATRDALRDAFPAHAIPVETRPMRSPWWIVPFAVLLGSEWMWRRRRGLR
ncbi:MAG: hypothetical protein M3R55_16850 [Acidobacteriota bacterium]|nr:hypothetical protein [Acidobacteriota bacterium]